MLKAFIIAALVLCISTNEVVEQDLTKDFLPWENKINCIINSELVRTTVTDLFELIKGRQWFDIVEYLFKRYPTLRGEIKRCITGADVQLGYNLDYLHCIRFYPPPYCMKFLPPEYLDPNYDNSNE